MTFTFELFVVIVVIPALKNYKLLDKLREHKHILYLHFMSFLHIDWTQVLKTLPQVREGPPYFI